MDSWFDFGKAIEVVEKRLGKMPAFLLLLSIYLAILAICISTFVKLLVMPLYEWVRGFQADPLSVDGQRLVAYVLTGLVVVIVCMIGFAVIPALRNLARRKLAQSMIDRLAWLRKEGLEVFNTTPQQIGGLEAWKTLRSEWRGKIEEMLKKNLTVAETLSFLNIGSVPAASFGHGDGNEHNSLLSRMSVELSLLQKLIDRYQERM